MAHNVRQRADSDAAWTTVLIASQLHNWDTYIFEAVNGDQGGTWAPAAAIIIGGAGLEITGPMTIDDLQDSHVTSGNALTVDSGGYIHVASGGLIDIQGPGGLTIAVAGTGVVNGYLYVANAGHIDVQSGGVVDVLSGGNVNLQSGSQLTQDAGAVATFEGVTTVGGVAAGTIAIGAYGALTFAAAVYPTMLDHYRWVPCRGYVTMQTPASWLDDGIGTICNVATQARLYYRFGVPGHLTVTSVEIWWEGPTHGTWPPENLTTFKLYLCDSSTGGRSLLASLADTSAQSTYEQPHSLVIASGLTTLCASDEFLQIEMVTENGTNAESGSKWLHAHMRVEFSQLIGL